LSCRQFFSAGSSSGHWKRYPEARAALGATRSEADTAALADLATRQDIRIPFTVRWNRQERRATIEIQGQTIALDQDAVLSRTGDDIEYVVFPHRGAIRALLVQDYQKFLKLASSVDGRYGEPANFRVKGRPCIRVLFRVMVRVGRAIFSTPAPMCRRDLGNMRHRRPTEPAQHSLRAHTSQPPHS
jgi:hypothetical protein